MRYKDKIKGIDTSVCVSSVPFHKSKKETENEDVNRINLTTTPRGEGAEYRQAVRSKEFVSNVTTTLCQRSMTGLLLCNVNDMPATTLLYIPYLFSIEENIPADCKYYFYKYIYGNK